MSAALFLAGPLADPAMQSAVLGCLPAAVPARLDGHRLDGDALRPAIVPAPGAAVEGLLAEASDEMIARLDHWHGGVASVAVTAETAGGPRAARAWPAAAGAGQGAGAGAGAWSPADWRARWSVIGPLAATEVMALRGSRPAADAFARWPQILTRATAAANAQARRPARLGHRARPGDVDELRRRQPYANYFAVEEYDLRFRRFDGTMSAVLNRAVFISGDAVVVLPYDPRTDRVLVIEQFRAGPHGRGDPQPWLVETVAGRIDGGETAEATARREAMEEAGLALGQLLPVAGYYPSPAAKAEYIYSFVGLCDLPEAAQRHGGIEGEGEDIRAHVIPFATLAAMAEAGEIANAPLLICVLWLAARRAGLRAAAGAPGA